MSRENHAEAQQIISFLTEQVRHFSKADLEAMQHIIVQEHKRRFRKRKQPRYGTLNRAFTEEEKEQFLKAITHPKARAITALMAGLGLRIGEACSIKTKDIDLVGRRIWIRSEKNSVPTSFFLHDQMQAAIQTYLIACAPDSDWLFPAVKSSNKYPHISPNWVSNHIRAARAKAGLNLSYGESEESDPERKTRPLYRLTSHSLRHAFGHKVFAATKDILVTQKLMRHVNIKNTQRYMWKGQDELDEAITTIFGGGRI